MSTTNDYFRADSGEFQCRHCEKRCAKQNTMYYHVQSKHSATNKFACSHCPDKKFIQKSTYLQHMATMHPADAEEDTNPYVGVSFTCPFPECQQSAKTKANILVHFARTHCKDWIPAYTKQPCKSCEKAFASSTAYFYHAPACCSAPATYHDMLQKMK